MKEDLRSKEEVLLELKATENGLSSSEADARLEKNGNLWGEIAAVLYITADGVWSGGGRGVPPFEISVGKSNLFNNWQ